jgi:DNA-binding GntR family transcriptional regulator
MTPDHEAQRRASDVAHELRAGILTGRYLPGRALREVSFSEQFGVSRRTVREAFLDLAREGLVVHRMNSGASVRRFDREDILDLYRIRRILEREGAHACTNVSSAELETVTRAFERLSIAAASGIISSELAEADAAFHGSIIALTGSSRLNEFYRGIGSQMAFAITLLQLEDANTSMSADHIIAEHQPIHDALLARDAQSAERFIIDHIDFYEGRLLDQLAADAEHRTASD